MDSADTPEHRPAHSTDQRDRVRADLISALRLVMRDEFIEEWLDHPVPALDGDTPRERIDAGDASAVYRLVAGLVEPGAM